MSGLDRDGFWELLSRTVLGGQDPMHVALTEIDPEHQKTLPDFLLTEKLLGIRTVDIRAIREDGGHLCWESDGKRIPIRRIYNRAIVDELERLSLANAFERAVCNIEGGCNELLDVLARERRLAQRP